MEAMWIVEQVVVKAMGAAVVVTVEVAVKVVGQAAESRTMDFHLHRRPQLLLPRLRRLPRHQSEDLALDGTRKDQMAMDGKGADQKAAVASMEGRLG